MRSAPQETLQSIVINCIEKNQRRLVVLAGEKVWTIKVAKNVARVLTNRECIWVSNDESIAELNEVESTKRGELRRQRILAPGQYARILGQETRCLIMDCFDGFYPDGVAALSGCVQGGGLFILLIPSWGEWLTAADEENKSRAVYGVDYREVSVRFKKRLQSIMNNHWGCVVYEQDEIDESCLGIVAPSLPFANATQSSKEQMLAVTALKKVSTGHGKRPLVISSDRGRGKSSAMGIAAAELMQKESKTIIVTAPRPESTVSLFKHANQEIGANKSSHGLSISYQRDKLEEGGAINSSLRFIPPDELLRGSYDADLLLVDEAAAIPTALLTALLQRYPRIAFTTTVHGYEGTGRGFAIRFQQTLHRLRPQWRHLILKQPIRWAEEDPLEALVNDLFLLNQKDVASRAVLEEKRTLNPALMKIEVVDRGKLIEDEECLKSLFSLLMVAHYRTTPSDLRDILDGPNLKLWVLTQDEIVYGVMLVACEGEVDEDMAVRVVAGERRPRGHLLPQQLAAQLGYQRALQLRAARVVRIAIHPQVQSQQWGTRLLRVFHQWAEQQKFDYIGSSFGATGPLIRFWKQSGFEPVRVGFTREASSGQHSLTVVKGLSDRGVDLTREITHRFHQQFAHQLQGDLKQLEPEIVFQLLQHLNLPPELGLNKQDQQDIAAFASGARSIESCRFGLWKGVLLVLSSSDAVAAMVENEINLSIQLFLQQYDEASIINLFQYTGRKRLMKQARSIASIMLTFRLLNE